MHFIKFLNILQTVSHLSMDSDERFKMDHEEESEVEEKNAPTQTPAKQIKKKKHGIIYISSIPKYMTVSILREFLTEHADVGRIYLQAASGQKKDEGNVLTALTIIHPN